jgi:hypothetical protein
MVKKLTMAKAITTSLIKPQDKAWGFCKKTKVISIYFFIINIQYSLHERSVGQGFSMIDFDVYYQLITDNTGK